MNQPVVSRKKTFLSDLGLFYAAAIWGSTFILVKSALAGIDPVTLVAYRFLLAGTILLVFLKLTGRSLTKDWGKSLFLSIILWLLYVPQTVGLKYTTASNSGFITGLFVFFIPLFLALIFKKRPTFFEWLASIISLSGLWVLTGGLTDVNIGDILTLLAALTYALHVLYSDKYMKMDVDPYRISCQQFLFVGAFSLIASLVLDLPMGISSKMAWGAVIFLALLPTLSAFVIQMIAQKFTAPVKVSLIFAFEPVFAGIFAWTLGGEEFTLRSAFGGGLIAIALAISGLPTPKLNWNQNLPYNKP